MSSSGGKESYYMQHYPTFDTLHNTEELIVKNQYRRKARSIIFGKSLTLGKFFSSVTRHVILHLFVAGIAKNPNDTYKFFTQLLNLNLHLSQLGLLFLASSLQNPSF